MLADWADRKLPIFPDEATVSDKVQVLMPEKLRQFYNKPKTADGKVTIDNPLFAYKFPEGIEPNIKVSKRPGFSI